MNAEDCRYVSKYLTHFVGRRLEENGALDVLCKVVRQRALLPGGNPNSWAGNVRVDLTKAFSTNDMFLPEVVCFCDIPLAEEMLKNHVQEYSKFGLVFDKAWLARERGASPVFYLAQGSCCTDHTYLDGHPCRGTNRKDFLDLAAHDWITAFFARKLESWQRSREENMFFWYFLSYCKFFDESRKDDDPKNVYNVYMEREWRTISSVRFEPTDIEGILLPDRFKDKFLEKLAADPCLECLKQKVTTYQQLGFSQDCWR